MCVRRSAIGFHRLPSERKDTSLSPPVRMINTRVAHETTDGFRIAHKSDINAVFILCMTVNMRWTNTDLRASKQARTAYMQIKHNRFCGRCHRDSGPQHIDVDGTYNVFHKYAENVRIGHIH